VSTVTARALSCCNSSTRPSGGGGMRRLVTQWCQWGVACLHQARRTCSIQVRETSAAPTAPYLSVEVLIVSLLLKASGPPLHS
jgi:hypothetical protein